MSNVRFYDCMNCPAWCCTYPRIPITKRDLRRIARHFDLREGQARRRFTKKGEEPGEIVLKHQKDEYFGSACVFLDVKNRRCTIYEARPNACRDYPGTVRCGYYDFLMAERTRQEDENHVATTDHRIVE
ncbi:MAG: hypothetical protein KatS3mg015_2315 [Fimbriimonadales bacterium]|nr:MAG: hypothetical protein KatS3mg015_2315 [Fimbriimonadales bacterium]